MTCMRALSEQHIIEDISQKVEYVFREEISISHNWIIKDNIRIPYTSSSNSNYFKERVYEWPKGSTILFEISDLLDEENRVRKIVESINGQNVRFGIDITLGCGDIRIDRITDGTGKNLTDHFISLIEYNRKITRFSLYAEFNDGYRTNNLQNISDEQIYIPASSIKGVVRKRFIAILDTFDNHDDWMAIKDYYVHTCFGNHTQGYTGCIIFHDAPIKNATFFKDKSVHVDKFTRDLIPESARAFLSYYGNVEIMIDLLQTSYYRDKRLPYILVLTLRDLCYQRINIGGGFAQGKGFLNAKEMKIKDSFTGDTCIIDFQNNTISNEPFLRKLSMPWEEKDF